MAILSEVTALIGGLLIEFGAPAFLILGVILYAVGHMKVDVPVLGSKPDTYKALAIVSFLLCGSVFVGIFGNAQPATINGYSGGGGNTETTQSITLNSPCGTGDKTSKALTKLYDDSSSTKGTPIAGSTVVLRDEDSGKIIDTATTSASGWVVLNGTGLCDDSGNGHTYQIYALTNAGATGSAKSGPIKLNVLSQYVSLHTNQISYATIRVKDLTSDDNGVAMYAFNNGGTTGANSTAAVNWNSTTFTSGIDASGITVGQDGFVKFVMYTKAATSRKYTNDKGMIGDGTSKTPIGLENIRCFDLAGGTAGQKWDADTCKVTNSGDQELDNIKESLDPITRSAVQVANSEICVDQGDIGDTEKAMYVYCKAKDSQNPDSNDDIKFYDITEGLFLSSKNIDNILMAGYTDASSPVSVGHNASYVQTGTVVIA